MDRMAWKHYGLWNFKFIVSIQGLAVFVDYLNVDVFYNVGEIIWIIYAWNFIYRQKTV